MAVNEITSHRNSHLLFVASLLFCSVSLGGSDVTSSIPDNAGLFYYYFTSSPSLLVLLVGPLKTINHK